MTFGQLVCLDTFLVCSWFKFHLLLCEGIIITYLMPYLVDILFAITSESSLMHLN
jgi:hypothetical protein